MQQFHLRHWSFSQNTFTSPPFQDKRSYKAFKTYLIRAWIHSQYDDSARVIKVKISNTEEPGKSNRDKLEQLNMLP